jgi:hypothetical protein
MALLDTRDAELCLWQDGSALCSPGFVLLDKGEYRFGEVAQQNARLRPRDVNNRFWFQLGTQALQPALGAARHTADLVHSHLRDLHARAGAPRELSLAVSDAMPREQLSLLLGVAGACDFSTVGLVSRSVLLGSMADLEDGALHVELQLHQALVNELKRDGDSVRLERSTPLPACGLLGLKERALSAIASAFIQQTRFDPRRSAASEQALYNQLPAILDALATSGETSIEVDGQRCRVSATALQSVTERLSSAVAQALGGRDLPLLAEDELLRLAALGGLPGRLLSLPPDALWQGYLRHRALIHGDGGGEALHLVDRLPRGGAVPPALRPAEQTLPPATPAAVTAVRATHVLLGTRALPLRGAQVELGGGYRLQEQGGQWTLHGADALVNGLPASPGQALVLGDTLSLGSVGHGRLIEVLE